MIAPGGVIYLKLQKIQWSDGREVMVIGIFLKGDENLKTLDTVWIIFYSQVFELPPDICEKVNGNDDLPTSVTVTVDGNSLGTILTFERNSATKKIQYKKVLIPFLEIEKWNVTVEDLWMR